MVLVEVRRHGAVNLRAGAAGRIAANATSWSATMCASLTYYPRDLASLIIPA